MKTKLVLIVLLSLLLVSCYDVQPSVYDINLDYETLDSSSVRLDWRPNVYGVRSYVLEKRETDTPFEQYKLFSVYQRSFVDTALELENNYYYRIYAITEDGISDYSQTVMVNISPEEFIEIELENEILDTTIVKLSWTDTYASVDNYIIEKSRRGAHYEPIAMLSGSDSVYIDDDVQPYENYTYRMYATFDDKVMQYSNETSVFISFGISIQDINMEMIFVEGDTFQMGDLWQAGIEDEQPVHNVFVSDMYVGAYEVTQKQYIAVMQQNPSYYSYINDRPVESMTFIDAIVFCNRLSIAKGYDPVYELDSSNYAFITVEWDSSKNGYRLPTEAEWEYASRSKGRNDRKWSGTNNELEVDDYAWANKHVTESQVVGGKLPNDIGLYDMTGNVWERCWDIYDSDYYIYSPVINPKGASSGSNRSNRGGSFGTWSVNARNANRNAGDIYLAKNQWNGFRVVRNG